MFFLILAMGFSALTALQATQQNWGWAVGDFLFAVAYAAGAYADLRKK